MKKHVILVAVIGALLGLVALEVTRIKKSEERALVKSPDSDSGEADIYRKNSSGTKSIENRPAPSTRHPKNDTKGSENSLIGRKKPIRVMGENPASKALPGRQHIAIAEQIYSALLDTLNLTAEERNHFLGLLAGEFADQLDLEGQMMRAKSSKERAILAKELEANTEINKEKVAKFLNDKKDQAAFEAYHDRLPEHRKMPGIKAAIALTGNELRLEQEVDLIDVMHRIRTSGDHAKKWEGASGMNLMAQENVVEIYEEDWARGQAAYREGLQGILDEDQYEAFFTKQAKTKEMRIMAIKMMRNMIKAGR
jgi:hypothetical protein